MIAHSQNAKEKPEGGVLEFSVAGRTYIRVNMHGAWGQHQFLVCTPAKDHLLVWNATAPNEKGLDAVLGTLNSISPLPPPSAPQSASQTEQTGGEAEATASKPVSAVPVKVKISSGVTSGLLVKKVAPVYPIEARSGHIQGTVVLQAEISKTGDITDLELLDGPIELAGSAVAAVREWKYKPYLLKGEPVAVVTQIQVNYQLRP